MGESGEKSLEPLRMGKIIQIGVVVKNLEKAVEFYTKHFGLGPWRKVVNEHLPYAIVLGKKTPYTCKLAITEIPPLTLELIEVTKGPSIQLDHLKTKGEGVHHIAYHVDNLEEEISRYEEHGFQVLQEMHGRERGFAYMNTDKVGGLIFEIVGPSPLHRGVSRNLITKRHQSLFFIIYRTHLLLFLTYAAKGYQSNI